MNGLARSIVAATALASTASGQAVLEYDHATGKGRLIVSESAPAIDVQSGASIRITWPSSIRVRVINGNTAVYRYSVETREAPAPATAVVGRVGDFLRQFRPYLPEVVLAAAGPATPRPRGDGVFGSILPTSAPDASHAVRLAWEAGRQAESALATLDDRLRGRGGLHDSMVQLLATLELMRAGGPVESLSRAFADSLSMPNAGCGASGAMQFPLTGDLLAAIRGVSESRRSLTHAAALAAVELRSTAALRALNDSLLRIAALSDSATTDVQSIIDAAYDFEQLALPVARACAGWNGRAIANVEMERRILTVRVEVRPEPELARVATRGSGSFNLTLVHAPLVVTSLGASALVATGAQYPVYETRTGSGGVEIFESSIRDTRFLWGVTLGAGWRVTDRLTQRGMRFWLPEFTINPSNDVKALAVGSALSFGLVKVGAGALWVRHSSLLGQTVGSIIPTKDHLLVADVYGKRKFYVSLSVFDVPPFTSNKQ